MNRTVSRALCRGLAGALVVLFPTLGTAQDELPEGSRANIKAQSRHANGSWTVMLYRKLDTGYDDDVAFNPRKKYNFAMALFDNSGDEDSYDSEVLTLQFSR